MDCSICSSMPVILRPPRNTICGACFEATKSIVSLIKKLDADAAAADKGSGHKTNGLISSSPNSSKSQPLANLPKLVNSMKETEEELNEKIRFMSGFATLFKNQILTDIELKPANHGPSIFAHRSLLAARSEIFKNMLDSDTCKAAAKDTITLTELNHEELETLMEFLYSGSLPAEKLEKHVYTLTLAADKYEIPYLLRFCERQMLRSLNTSNALDVLEISDSCSNKILKEAALSFIIKNIEEIIFSAKYEAFVPKNPHLAIHIARALLIDAKNNIKVC